MHHFGMSYLPIKKSINFVIGHCLFAIAQLLVLLFFSVCIIQKTGRSKPKSLSRLGTQHNPVEAQQSRPVT